MTQLKPKTILEDNLHTAKDVSDARDRLLALMCKVTTPSPTSESKESAIVVKKVIWV